MGVRFTAPRRGRVTFGPGRALAGETNVEIDHLLAALEVDTTPVRGVQLKADRTVAGRLGLSLADPSLVPLTRYGLVTETDAAVTEDDWLASGITSGTRDMTFPAADGAPLHQGIPIRYYRIAIPDVLGDLQSVLQVILGVAAGLESRFNWIPAIGAPAVLQTIAGVDCLTYRTSFVQFAANALTFRFETSEGEPIDPGVPVATRRYLLISPDENFEVNEVVGQVYQGAVATIPPDAIPVGERRYVAVARPAGEGEFETVYYYQPGQRNENNQINAWENIARMLDLELGTPFRLLRSRVSLRDTANGRVVEAT